MSRTRGITAHLTLALLAYVPMVRAHPGRVGADTKTYLYVDPGRLLERALTMWDPNTGLGTLTHQTIGYLFPMGPWYWLFEKLGSPDWFAQRMWLATVIFAAGAGVLYFGRTIALGGAASVVAALVYMLSPYVLDYSARISVILLPWAALPWLIGLADHALRRGGWRHPALFALVVLTVGGVNATALAFAGLGPVLWLVFATMNRETSLRAALATAARIGVLTTVVSLWWVVALAVQGVFGIDILRFTETIEAVSVSSLSAEVLRGLGYWFFYGNDKLGPWIEPSVTYTQDVPLLVLTFLLPVLGLAAAGTLRWRHRAFAVTLVVLGTFIAVGAYPYHAPTLTGRAIKAFATGSTVGLALRSTARAVPLLVLGFALVLGAALTALATRVPRAAGAIAAVCAVLAVANMPPLFTGDVAVVDHLNRPEHIPAYWHSAAAYLDAQGDQTRVLELPGTDFASYRWGNTVDPVTPYLMDRPFVARELIPFGSEPSADLLIAFDRRMQEGLFEGGAVAPIARLLGVGDVALRNDLQFERFRTPRPRLLWQWFTSPRPEGLDAPVPFGPASPNTPAEGLGSVDEIELGLPIDLAHPPAVSVFPVNDAEPIVRAEPAARPTIVEGDGEGLVDIAAAGLLDGKSGVVRYAGAFAGPLPKDATLIVTDTNRMRARRWGTVRENVGFTESASTAPLEDDPADARFELFPDAPARSFTTAEQLGVRAVRATRYGNPVSYTPEDRAANAFDGDSNTAWRVGAFSDVAGERVRVDLESPRRVGVVRLVQPLNGPRNRFVTRARIHLDDDIVDVDLDESSRTDSGQLVTFADRSVRRVEVEVLDTNIGKRPRYDGFSGVGFAEIDVGDDGTVRVDEVVRLPVDLAERARRDGAPDPTFVMTRLRADPGVPVRSDEELQLKRAFVVPRDAEYFARGTARLSAHAADAVLDRALGVPALGAGAAAARSDGRLPGDVSARASSAIDGDMSTVWSPGFLDQAGHWLEVETSQPITVDRLDLVLVADGRHSVPTRLRLDVDGQLGARTIDVPAVDDQRAPGATATVPVSFDAVRGHVFRVTIEAARSVRTIDYFSGLPIDLPVGVAELGMPGVTGAAPAGPESACRDDLLTIDGRAFQVRVLGDTEEAVRRDALRVEACESVHLTAGEHDLRSAIGRDGGVDIDRIVLAPASAPAEGRADPPATVSTARVVDSSRTSFDVELDAGTQPTWLVLAQSHNAGWHARAGGKDLGEPALVDGFANGWLVPAGTTSVQLEWTPQRFVWVGLGVSALGVLLCLVLAFASRPRPVAARVDAPALSIAFGFGRGGAGIPASPRPKRTSEAVAALTCTVAAFAVAGAGAAVVVGAVSALAMVHPLVGQIARFAPAAALASAGSYVVIQQVRYDFPPDFGWPTNFHAAHVLAWIAIVLLVERVWVEHATLRPERDRYRKT